MTIVSIDNVWVTKDHVPILEDVTFTINKNDFISIIGPNGGGKTTLLKVILGLITPTRGRVRVFGKPPEEGRTHIGYLPQHTSFDMNFPITVSEVVIMGRYKNPFTHYSEKDSQHVSDALNLVGMAHYADRQIGQLSGGELQRVLLARALARAPELLLLDEPTASIDPEMQKSFYELLSALKKNMAIVLVTHDVGVVSTYVEKIVCLNRNLHYHGDVEGGLKKLEDIYKCPIEVLAHGVPHRVLRRHSDDRDSSV